MSTTFWSSKDEVLILLCAAVDYSVKCFRSLGFVYIHWQFETLFTPLFFMTSPNFPSSKRGEGNDYIFILGGTYPPSVWVTFGCYECIILVIQYIWFIVEGDCLVKAHLLLLCLVTEANRSPFNWCFYCNASPNQVVLVPCFIHLTV